MEVSTLMTLGFAVGFVLAVGMIVLIAYSRLYKRASADEALVRTGKGGTRAVAGGGMMVVPIFHTLRRISLKQAMISITRTGRDSLVTADKIRADVEGTMYVRVGDNDTDIIQAAKTFGDVGASEVERLIADKVTDAMRAEAMKVSFLELNVNKREFGEAIAAAVQQDLKKTGLVLDSVAVTTIRQVEVNPEAIPMDVFEAEGVRNIVAVVEKNREETNRIRRRKEVEIQQVDVEARKEMLLLEEAQRQAEAEQRQRVASYEAEKQTDAEQAVLIQRRIAEEAAIAKEEEVAKRAIARDRAIAVDTAGKQEAERVAQTLATQAIERAEIEKAKAVETAEVDKKKAIAMARAQEAAARAAQADAEAEEEKAKEAITTVKERAEADRSRAVAVIKAQEEAEKQQIDADRDAYVETKHAQAERDARKAKAEAEAFEAAERARAAREHAQGCADAIKIEAEGYSFDVATRAQADAAAAGLQAQAKTELARAALEEGKAAAETERLMVEARNEVAPHILVRDVAVEIVKNAPATIEAFMLPVSAISDVKVMQMHGMDGGAANGNGTPASLPGMVARTLAQSAGFLPVINTMLDFARQAGIADKAKQLAAEATSTVREAIGAEPNRAEIARPAELVDEKPAA